MFRNLILAGVVALASAPALAESRKISDPQIAHISYTAGQLDIAADKLALTKAIERRGSRLRLMERDHAAVNDQALALVKRLNVTPEANATSEALSKQAAEAESRLEKLSGAAFDRAYVENEISYHRSVNEALRTTLIPSAKNSELKGLLETGLKLFQEHQAHAEHLARSLK